MVVGEGDKVKLGMTSCCVESVDSLAVDAVPARFVNVVVVCQVV